MPRATPFGMRRSRPEQWFAAVLITLNYAILIDKTKQSDNFKASMNFAFPKMIPVYSDDGYDGNRMEIMEMYAI